MQAQSVPWVSDGWPQPGRYRFRLPPSLTRCWEVTNPVSIPAIDKFAPERYAHAKFDEEHPLQIIDADDPACL